MLVETSKIKVADRIRKDFGNIDELADDIKENGLINPPVVTPDFELIAGERRLRACRHLGYEQIEVRIMTVKDEEHQLKLEISENENRKEFTFSERIDWAKRLERVEKINAKDRQGERSDLNIPKNSSECLKGDTRQIVAEKSGFGSHDTFNKAKFIAENADSAVIQKLNEEKISIHKAWLETKERLSEVEVENKRLKNRPPEVIEKEIIKEVDRTDYKAIENLKKELEGKNNLYRIAKEKEELYKNQLDLYEIDSQKYKDLTRQIELLTKEKDDLGRAVTSTTELSGYIYKIETFLKDELAPIKYSRSLIESKDNKVVMDNIRQIVDVVQDWCDDISHYLPLEYQNIIHMEVER